MSGELRDCPLCGLPMEVKTAWVQVVFAGTVKTPTDMVTAACVVGHWYGGPAKDLTKEAVQ